MLDRDSDEGYKFTVTTEKYVNEHGVIESNDDDELEIYIGYAESDNVLEEFEIFLEELCEKHKKKFWRCKNCGNYYWTNSEEHSPNCKNCGNPLSKS
jgi:rubrerythrin